MSKYQSIIPIERLRGTARDLLNLRAIRCFAVKKPLKLRIINFREIYKSDEYTITRPNHPINDLGSHKINLTENIYIESDDWRDVDSKDYYGLAPNKIVRLKYGPFIKCESVLNNNEIICKIIDPMNEKDKFNPKKIKGCLHWLNTLSSDQIEMWDINDLINTDGSYNENSLVKSTGFIEADSEFIKTHSKSELQFERLGYYKYDAKYNAYIQIAKLRESH
jgi:glutaminyl-tRNA synthetase